jgi:CheY-like chemotaxis protein
MYSLGKEGSGSTFFFTLPAIQPQEPASDLEQYSSSQQYSIAFLTQQDDLSNPVTDQLAANGIDVKVYPVDKDPVWLPKLLVSKSSAIILDEQLAAHLGWEILHVLKRHASTEQIPVMVHTYDQTKDQGSVLELNYLQKPLSPDHLAEMLSLQAITFQGDSQKRSILVVDDDPDTLEFNARLVLSQIGNCQVYRARSGLEAVAVIREIPLNLVLLDLVMPDLDGFGVLEMMQENERTRAVPVIVITAKTLTGTDLERFNRGVVAVLNKGMFSAKETVDRILGVLSKIPTPGSMAHKMVRKAVAYIHAHYQEPITRDQIAKFIGINADYLTVCFNQELGIPTMTYLNRYRVNRAQTLLEMQDKKITEIAAEVGFSDSAYFSRIFLRETGVSPRAYQRGKRAPG